MIRLLILASFGAVINCFSLPSYAADYPHNLGWLFGYKDVADSKDDRSVCNSIDCKVIAKVILESIDNSVDPCDDFYEYACGSWSKNNPVPEGETEWNIWEMTMSNIRYQIKQLVEAGPQKDDILPVKLVKKWYKSCMNTDRIEEKGAEPLLSTISQIGGWPLIMEEGEWHESLYKWQKVDDNYARLTGSSAFFDVHVGQLHWYDESSIVVLSTPDLPPKSQSLISKDDSSDEEQSDESIRAEGSGGNDDDDDDGEGSGEKGDDEDEDDDDDSDNNCKEDVATNRKKYKKFILNVALALAEARGTEIPEEKLMKDIDDMIEFQVKLTKLAYQGDYDLLNTTLDEFQESCNAQGYSKNGKVNWAKMTRRQFLEAGVEIDNDIDIVVTKPEYMKGVGGLLEETSSETIVNYIHWNMVSRMIKATTKQLRDLLGEWVGEKEEEEDRYKTCLMLVKMANIIGYDYVKKHFSEDIKSTATDMIDDIQKEVEYQIKESTWMDDDTKDFILDKLVNMEKIVGYPEWYKNTTYVKRYFSGLSIGTSFYENILNVLRYYKWKMLQAVNEEKHEDAPWDVDPLILNAFFLPTENSIIITAADFQSPFFALRRPWSMNYGIIGSIMAHEVNHGFDDSGHLYNKKGTIMEWLSAMASAYNERAICFVDQFDKYSILNSKNVTIEHYGNQTAGENIADTMGLQAAYRAYQRRQRECGKEGDALPGLEKFSNDQLFFLSFANLWCETIDPEEAVMSAKYDEHSTGRLRVIGSVSNSEDFAKAYNCPVGSPMNPKKKCNIWK